MEIGNILFWFQKEKRDFCKEVRLACWEGSKIAKERFASILMFLKPKGSSLAYRNMKGMKSEATDSKTQHLFRAVAEAMWWESTPGTVLSWLDKEAQEQHACHLDVFLRVQCFWEVSQKVFLKILTVIKEHLGSLSSVQLELLEFYLVFVVNFILKYNIRTKYVYN